jgi:hypothetical protein
MDRKSWTLVLIMFGWSLLSLPSSAIRASGFAPSNEGKDRENGTVTLDENGFGQVLLADGYLDTHFCSVADGWDDVSVGFSAKFFTVSEGKPNQKIAWACVPLNRKN